MQVRLEDIINTTPHEITLVSGTGKGFVIPVNQAMQLRMYQQPAVLRGTVLLCGGERLDIVSSPTFDRIAGPMAELIERNMPIIVSMPVGEFIRAHRREGFEELVVLGPDTGPSGAVRGDKGQIVGTRNLIQY